MTRIIKTGIIQQRKTDNADDNRSRLAAAARRLAEEGAQLIVNQELQDSL